MRSSRFKLYLPFIALAVVQATLMAVAPSVNDDAGGLNAAGFDPNAPAANGATFDPNAPAAGTDPNAPAAGTDPNAPAAPTDPNAPAAPGAPGGPAPAGGPGAPGGGTCEGPQQKVTRVSPPCVPPFEGDNGGATYQGVTAEEIKVVVFSSEPNAQVDAILATQGLASTEEEFQAFFAASEKFLNDNYEFYGRRIKFDRVVGDCPTTPPDVAACKAAARDVINRKPFMVVWATPLYPSVFDEFARAGIVSIGGWQFDESLFTRRAPFRYDPLMDGTQNARFIGEYYCKKMAKQAVTHSGQIVHPTIGNRGQAPRRLGIVTPEANLPAAVVLRDIVAGCDAQQPVVKTYVSDITTASQQTAATLSALIQGKVTTVACLCDPIAPTFLTSGATSQRYFPEHLLTGFQFQDSDLVGRLYDDEQWKHAFGPVALPPQNKQEDGDEDRVFRAGGGSGNACNTCGVPWLYFGMMASMLQRTGPNLNPQTLHQATLSMPPQGGTPEVPLLQFGQGDYTLISDVREVYWSNSQASPVDGKAGTYIGVAGSRRMRLGQIPGGGLSGIPVEPS